MRILFLLSTAEEKNGEGFRGWKWRSKCGEIKQSTVAQKTPNLQCSSRSPQKAQRRRERLHLSRRSDSDRESVTSVEPRCVSERTRKWERRGIIYPDGPERVRLPYLFWTSQLPRLSGLFIFPVHYSLCSFRRENWGFFFSFFYIGKDLVSRFTKWLVSYFHY